MFLLWEQSHISYFLVLFLINKVSIQRFLGICGFQMRLQDQNRKTEKTNIRIAL